MSRVSILYPQNGLQGDEIMTEAEAFLTNCRRADGRLVDIGIAASCVAEAVAAHAPRKLVLFAGRIVARDGSFLPAAIPITSDALA